MTQLLSAEWMNERIKNVLDQTEQIIDRILLDGLLSSGYMVFEQPIDDPEFIKKLTPDQFQGLLDTQATIEQKSNLIKGLIGSESERILRGPLT